MLRELPDIELPDVGRVDRGDEVDGAHEGSGARAVGAGTGHGVGDVDDEPAAGIGLALRNLALKSPPIGECYIVNHRKYQPLARDWPAP